MEEQKQLKKMEIISRKGRITKKKRRKQLHNPQSHTVFPLLLAAILSKSRNNQALMKKCLNQTILSVPHLLFAPVLSLIAALLKSNCVEIVCKSAELLGVASLSSFEMNEKVAGDGEIVKSLISLLGSSMREISMVACNAMLDLATASVGCQRLLQFSAIEKLIGRAIPTVLSESYLVHLKRLWGIVNKQRFYITSSKGDLGKEFYTFNIATNKLAESTFILSITSRLHLQPVAFDMSTESIFGLGETTFELFLSNIWEVSPMLARNSAQASASEDGIFGPFIQFLGPKEAIRSQAFFQQY